MACELSTVANVLEAQITFEQRKVDELLGLERKDLFWISGRLPYFLVSGIFISLAFLYQFQAWPCMFATASALTLYALHIANKSMEAKEEAFAILSNRLRQTETLILQLRSVASSYDESDDGLKGVIENLRKGRVSISATSMIVLPRASDLCIR